MSLADVRAKLKAAQDGWGRTANDLASETQRANRAERRAELAEAERNRWHNEAHDTPPFHAWDDCPTRAVHKAAEEPDFAIRALRVFRKALNELYREEEPMKLTVTCASCQRSFVRGGFTVPDDLNERGVGVIAESCSRCERRNP